MVPGLQVGQVDNVIVVNGPSPIQGYYVYLNDVFVDQTAIDVREYTFMDLAYGETYEACVRALYACGLSDPICYTWTSSYLHPPRDLVMSIFMELTKCL
jgi:hypothetical protein